MIFLHALNNETLLGIDSLRKAHVIVDIHRNTWLPADRPHVVHNLYSETSRRSVWCASADVMRIDEGTMLSPPKYAELVAALQECQDVFKEGSTPFAEHRIETGNHHPIAVPAYHLLQPKRILWKQISKKC